MLIIIGFVCLLHLPTSELRRTANVNFWTEVSRMNSTQEFYRKYVNKAYEMLRGYEDTLQGSIQQESPESLLQQAPLFPCYPMNTSVPLPADPDPRYERVPPCAIVPRCGGCCGPIYTCLPKTIVPYPVKVFRGIPGPDESFSEVTLMVDRHTECECSCAVLASDCNPTTHTYISAECLCRCKNADQATSCSPQKTWDDKLCRCRCRNIIDCLDDEVFNFATCSCERRT